MSDARRLLKDGASGFERELLRAARHDLPSREARSRLLVSLGVVAATTTAEAAGAAGVATAATKAWLLKSMGIAVLATATSVAAVHVARSAADHARRALATVTTTAGAGPASVPVATATPVATVAAHPFVALVLPQSSAAVGPPVRSTPARTPAIAPPVPPASSVPTVAHAATTASLREETSTLDEARAALRAMRSREALGLLDRYAHRFPDGALQPEAGALRVEALLDEGDRAGAESVARALLATQQRTAAAHRVRAMLNW